MKREGIRRRQKVFLTFLLAVIIGVLPTVEVWAQTFQVVKENDNENVINFLLKINNTSINPLHSTVSYSGSTVNGTLKFYTYKDDKISIEGGATVPSSLDTIFDKPGTTADTDDAPTATGVTKPVWGGTANNVLT